MADPKPKLYRDLTPPQRYMLSLLNLDGELRIQRGFKLTRNNGSQAGFQTSARALVFHGLARYSDDHARLLCTPEGRAAFAPPNDATHEPDLENCGD